MTPVELQLIISLATVACSLGGAAFIAGSRWGRVQAELAALKAERGQLATKTDVQAVSERVAEIRGMFTLTIRDEGHH